jgi:WD40 repeat protein/serine/threonine protein kinase
MTDDSALLGQLAEEFTTGVRQGGQPDIEGYAAGHPELAGRIRELFPALLMLEGLAAGATAPAGGSPPPAAGPGPAAGQSFGPYQIVREVGRGGMGVVYEATHLALTKRVALKVLPVYSPGAASRLERFLREARTAAALHHTNIVPVFDVGQVDTTPYYAMQFIDGAGLDRVLRRLRRARAGAPDAPTHVAQTAPYTPPGDEPADEEGPDETGDGPDPAANVPEAPADFFRWVVGLGIQAADGLHHAHQRGVIHRDVKPSNLLLDGAGVLWITDFGLARRAEDVALTREGVLLGTPRYMSPEQAEAAKRPIDHRTDVYSLGATLYELVTRRPAFNGRTPQEVVGQIIGREPLAPRRLDPRVPRDLETVILKAMAKRPGDRYQTADELADDLRRWLRLEPVRARRLGPLGRTWRWCRRNPAVAALTAAVAALLVAVAVGSGAVALHLGHLAERERAVAVNERDARQAADEARDDAVNARQAADRARDDAVEARGKEEEQRRHAEDEAAAKDRARRRAEGLYLSSRSSALLPTNPDLALLLAIEGARRHVSPLTNHALLAALDGAAESRTLVGHPYEVTTARFSPDGKRVLTTTGRGDMTARVWDVETGKEVLVLKAPRAIQSAVFSPDGKLVLTGAYLDATPRVWDAATGNEVAILKGQLVQAQPGAFSPDGRRVVTPAENNTARVSEAATGKEAFVLQGHTAPVRLASFGPDGRRILTVSADQTVRVWDTESGAVTRLDWLVGKHQLAARSGSGELLPAEVKSAEFSPDGGRVLTTDTDYVGRVWDVTTGKEIVTLRYGVDHARFSPDGKRVIVWSNGAQFAFVQVRDATTGAETARLSGHTDGITSAEFSADGKRVVTTSYDRTVRLWEVAGGREIAVLRGHQGHVNHAAFSPDGRWVASASNDRTARVWGARGGKERATLTERGNAQFLAASPDGKWVVLPTTRFAAGVWDAAGGKAPVRLPQAVSSPVISPDGKLVLDAVGNTARLWDAATGEERAALRGHTDRARSARFSPDGKQVVTASDDRTARLWETATGRPLLTLTGHADHVASAVFSRDGRRVLTAGEDRTARVWDATTGKELSVLRGHKDMLRSAAFGLDGRRVVTVAADHTGRVWDAETGKELASAPEVEEFKAPEVSADGKRWISFRSFTGSSVRVWDLETGKELLTIRVPGGHLRSAALSPDGGRVVTAAEDGVMRVWEAATGKELPGFQPPQGGFGSAVFSPDGKRLLAADNDDVRLWDAATGQELNTVLAREGRVLSVAFDPDGRRVLATLMRDSLSVWDVAAHTEVVTDNGHAWQIWAVGFSPDGRRFVSASFDRTARVWETATGKSVAVLAGHEGRVFTAAFSPDGKRVVTASGDHTARVWEADTGKEVAVLKGHADEVHMAAFSPDGRRVLTAGMDAVPRVWDAATGEELLALRGHEASVVVALFSPDGRHILTAASGSLPLHEKDDGKRQVIGARVSKDQTTRLWDAATGKEEAVLALDGGAWAAAFSPDGRALVTATGKSVRLWETATGREVLALKGSEAVSRGVAFSPDGRQVLTVGRGVCLWDAATGRQVLALEREVDFRAAAFAAGGRSLVTLSAAGAVRTWPTDPLAEALERKPRDLTPEEQAALALEVPEGP